MPLYEYQCDSCGHRFEIIQKFSDPLVESCPACGGTVRKLLSSPAIQFKGSGWYITDYARKEKTDKAATSESAGTPSSKDASEAGASAEAGKAAAGGAKDAAAGSTTSRSGSSSASTEQASTSASSKKS